MLKICEEMLQRRLSCRRDVWRFRSHFGSSLQQESHRPLSARRAHGGGLRCAAQRSAQNEADDDTLRPRGAGRPGVEAMLRQLWAPPRTRRRLRGGWRQRADDDDDDDELGEGRISRLAGGILLDWADGVTSAESLQRHMRNEDLDQRDLGQRAHPMVQRLAQVGEGPHAHAGLRTVLERVGLLTLQTTIEALGNVLGSSDPKL